MRYLAFLACLLFAAPAMAQCPGGQCRRPVRNIVVPAAKAAVTTTAKIAAAPVRVVHQAYSSPKQRSLTRSVTWQRTRLMHRIRFAPQRRWR